MFRPGSSPSNSGKERPLPLDQSTTDSKLSDVHKSEENKKRNVEGTKRIPTSAASATVATAERDLYEPFENGYHFPPSHSWQQSLRIGAKTFGNYTRTPLGFFVVIYGLNVVAWGGMLFLLLCNAAPAMCYPTCNHINSPRRQWIEWDSQIVNALFCVTGFGLAPWRFRDLYFLLRYRILRNSEALRRLAGIHRGWFRLPGSDQLPATVGPDNVEDLMVDGPLLHVPRPLKAIPDLPLTGMRAPATPIWKMDFVIWFNVLNTFLQCVLCGFMWGMNRYNRPSWATGLFVALACIAAAIGGLMMFYESRRIKSIEGVKVSEEDNKRLVTDKELGIQHYNNIRDKIPKEKKKY